MIRKFLCYLLVRYRRNQVNVLQERIEKGELFTPFPYSLIFIDNHRKDVIKYEKLLEKALNRWNLK